MVCFRSWVKYYGDPSDHIVKLPKEIEDLEPDKRIDLENPYADKVEVEEATPPAEEVKKEVKTEGDAEGGEESEEEK